LRWLVYFFPVGRSLITLVSVNFKVRVENMNKIIIRMCLPAVVAIAISLSAQPPANHAAEAFKKVQSLAGDWQGKDEQGNEVKSNFKLMISNTVVMETLDASGMEEMLTLYSVDGNGISLLHYCPTNNQPHMRAVPASNNVKELVFSFLDAGNLSSIAVGHEHKMVMEFDDKDHITERWTWQKNGKDTEMIYHLVRKK
jgi:hypothetical protein